MNRQNEPRGAAPLQAHELLVEAMPGVLHLGAARVALLDIEAGFRGIRSQMDALVGSRLAGSVMQQAGANGGASFAATFGRAGDAAQQQRLFAACVQAYQAAGFGRFQVTELQWPVGQADAIRVVVRAHDAFEAWMARRHVRHSAQRPGGPGPGGPGPGGRSPTDRPTCDYTAGVLVGFVNVITGRRDVVCVERRCQAQGHACCEFELLPASESQAQSVAAFVPDPALGRQLNLLEMLFDRMPMGIAVIDTNFRLARCNPTWAAFIDRYTPSRAAQVLPGARIFDLEPGTEDTLIPLFNRVLQGETVRQEAVRIESGGIESFWDVVLSPLYEGDSADQARIAGILNVSIDATERVLMQRTLEQRVEERTRELSTLLRISRDVSSTLDLGALLGGVLDQLKTVVPYDGASLMILERDALRILAYRGPIPPETIDRLRIPFNAAASNYAVITTGQPSIIPDVLEDSPAGQAFRQTAGEHLDSLFAYIRCWMGVPLIAKGQVIGMLSLDHSRPGYYTPASAALALAFAHQAAVAIDNARLYQEAEQRRQVAESLKDTLSILNTDRPLREILGHIVTQAQRLLQASAAAIHQLDSQTGALTPQASIGLSPEYIANIHLRIGQGALGRAVLIRRPVEVNDTQAVFSGGEARSVDGAVIALDPPVRARLQAVKDRYGAVLAVPMSIKSEIYGGLALYYKTPRAFLPGEVQLAVTFADQAALAIENAILRAQAAERAKADERSRLARDLHDAVTQTLFSASLIADVLPALWERRPEMGRQKLDELRRLTRGALSEMRTLLLELRPDALAEVDLGDLLQHLANAVGARAGIQAQLERVGQPVLPQEVKEVFYRVAQEALNNIAKHAGATEVYLRLVAQDEWVDVAIEDNGRGFDISAVPLDRLGVRIMRERAATIGATLTIDTAPGAGARIQLRWRANSAPAALPEKLT